METIPRLLKQKIESRMGVGKVMLLYGARRVGKTFLLEQIIREFDGKYMKMNGDDGDTLRLLEDRSISNYRRLFNEIKLLVIDEAQQIPDIGMKLKLMADEVPGLQIIASGSSAYKLLDQTLEPLTGRCYLFPMFPVSQAELSLRENMLETRQNLEDRLIFGSYPEVLGITNKTERQQYLFSLVNTYLYKDILSIDGVRHAGKLTDLLRMIAYQTGKEVSNEELARNLNMSKTTIEKYLDLLSRVYLIFRLNGFSRNLRKEVTKNCKWYFYDNGLRNALVSDLRPLALRHDTGDLWENYLISERQKKISYNDLPVEMFFWRTYDQQEIDVIERSMDSLSAFEIKWKDRKVRFPAAWKTHYPESENTMISTENYLDWIA